MLSSVLRSQRAVEVNIAIVRKPDQHRHTAERRDRKRSGAVLEQR